MRKILKSLLFCVLIALMSSFFVCCKDANNDASNNTSTTESNNVSNDTKNGLTFNTLLVEETTVYGTVANNVKIFSFIDEIKTEGKTKFIVSLDVYGSQIVATKTIPLEIGDNIVYITELIDDEPANVFTVTIRRRPMYSVTIDNGTFKLSYSLEEGALIDMPTESTKEGYNFKGWTYDFSQPIKNNITISAIWEARTDTKYIVNYYLENLENDEYTLYETEELLGITDSKVKAEIKEYPHFTYHMGKSTAQGNICGNGSLVLDIYYRRNQYALLIDNSNAGDITNVGKYKYGQEITSKITEICLGYDFLGWYCGNELLSINMTYDFIADKDVTAKFIIKEEMSNFNFIATNTTCKITGIKDKTVEKITIPIYITSIANVAFEGCKNLIEVQYNASKCVMDKSFYGTIFYTAGSEGTGIVVKIGANVQEIPAYFTDLWSVYIKCIEFEEGSVCVKIGEQAFRSCYKLAKIILPNSVTRIESGAFHSCSKLTSIRISEAVTSIGDYAFYYCDSLENIYFSAMYSWYTTRNEIDWNNKTGGTSKDLYSSTANAKYFTKTYYDCYWYKL